MDIINSIIKYKNHSENFFWRSGQWLAKKVFEFVIFYLAANSFTPEQFGKYNFLLALMGLVVIFAEFGLSNSVCRYVAECKVNNDDKIKSIVFSSISISFILSFVISIIVFIMGKYNYFDYYEYLIYLIPLIFLTSEINILDGFYRGLNEFKKLALITTFTGLIALVTTYFLIITYGILGALCAQIIFYGLSYIFLVKSIKETRLSFNKNVIKEIFKYAIILGLSNLGYFLFTCLDILILEYYGYTVEIGYYQIIKIMVNFILIPFIILTHVIFSSITQMVTKKEYFRLKKLILKIPFIMIIGFGVGIIAYFLFPPLIQIIFPKYWNKTFLIILSVMLVLIPFRISGIILNLGFIIPSNYGKLTVIMDTICGIFTIILDFLFIAWFGFIGVFYAALIIEISNFIVKYTIFYIIILKKTSNSLTIK